MLELYLVVSLASTSPVITAYPNMDAACEAFNQNPTGSHIFIEQIARKGTATITEGSCKPVQKFTVTAK